MQLLILILKNVELIDDLIKELAKNEIHGCTVLDGHGMGEAIVEMGDLPMFGTLRSLLSSSSKQVSKVMLIAIKDEELTKVSGLIKGVVGDLSKPNTGIMLSIPVTFCEGLVD